MQFLGGSGEALELDHGEELAQLAEFNVHRLNGRNSFRQRQRGAIH
jgi:hypothetical protein